MLAKSDKLDPKSEMDVLRYSIVFYLTITIREKNESLNDFVLKRITKGIDKFHSLADWVVHLFSIERFFDEYFLNNPFK